jgi:carbonic anhydrase
MMTPQAALERLQVGNVRFVSKVLTREAPSSHLLSCGLPGADQEPFAIILGCSDSRVPAEIVFDQGLGDLFVIRVAGNIVAPSQIGSIEFAAERFGTRLVVVLGHSRCGAIQATLEELRRPGANQSPNLRSIVDRVRPAVETLIENGTHLEDRMLLDMAVWANIRASVQQLRHGSEILENLIAHNDLMVVGAEYSLETGEVKFLEDAPLTSPT